MTAPDESASSYRQPAQKAASILSGDWVIAVLYTLATRPRRFMDLIDEINNNEKRLGPNPRKLTRKVLSTTLKAMRRDGLVIRTSGATEVKFSAVWYQLTPMGREFLRATVHLAKLGLRYESEIDQARVRYDHEATRGTESHAGSEPRS